MTELASFQEKITDKSLRALVTAAPLASTVAAGVLIGMTATGAVPMLPGIILSAGAIKATSFLTKIYKAAMADEALASVDIPSAGKLTRTLEDLKSSKASLEDDVNDTAQTLWPPEPGRNHNP